MKRDRRKLTFYFVADRRIDFRDLVKELFKIYKTRIWLCSCGTNQQSQPNAPALPSENAYRPPPGFGNMVLYGAPWMSGMPPGIPPGMPMMSRDFYNGPTEPRRSHDQE
jgi:hypothetical protein